MELLITCRDKLDTLKIWLSVWRSNLGRLPSFQLSCVSPHSWAEWYTVASWLSFTLLSCITLASWYSITLLSCITVASWHSFTLPLSITVISWYYVVTPSCITVVSWHFITLTPCITVSYCYAIPYHLSFSALFRSL